MIRLPSLFFVSLVTRGGLNVPLSSSPTNLSSFPSSSIGHRASSAPSTAAREAAIELLVQGLRHELAKPVKKTLRNLRGQSITLGSSSDEDGTEGRFFSLERVDDLGRAVCTPRSRPGVLHKVVDASLTFSRPFHSSATTFVTAA